MCKSMSKVNTENGFVWWGKKKEEEEEEEEEPVIQKKKDKKRKKEEVEEINETKEPRRSKELTKQKNRGKDDSDQDEARIDQPAEVTIRFRSCRYRSVSAALFIRSCVSGFWCMEQLGGGKI